MIYGFFVLNEFGEIRLARSYVEMSVDCRNRLAYEIFKLISTRSQDLSNIVKGTGIQAYVFPRNPSIVYRRYAALYVVAIIDDIENPLAVLDIIHSFVQVLDGCFKDVSEVEIAYHPDKALQALDQLIHGGLLFESDQAIALQRIAEENTQDKKFAIHMPSSK